MKDSQKSSPGAFLVRVLLFATITTVAFGKDPIEDINLSQKLSGCSSPYRGCHCDEGCKYYGDCCFDSPNFKEFEQRRARQSFKCVESKNLDGRGLYMVAKCSPEWKDKRTRYKCESARDKIADPLTAEPVVSRNSILYRNAYCAYCNMAEEFDFVGVHVVCGSENNQLKSDGKITSDLRVISNDSSASCNFRMHDRLPSASRRDNKADSSTYYNFRQCIPQVIDTCTNLTDQNVRRMCETYTSYYKSGDHPLRIYRNPFCRLCNSVTVPSPVNITNVGSHHSGSIDSNFLNETFLYPWAQVKKPLFLLHKNTLRSLNHLLAQGYNIVANNTCEQKNRSSTKECVCKNNFKQDLPLTFEDVSRILMSTFSNIFLSLHLVIFALNPRRNRTLLDYNLASYCSALLLRNILLRLLPLVIGFLNDNCEKLPVRVCLKLFILIHYSDIVTFMWMLTMSFDVWRSMREAEKCLKPETLGQRRRRFSAYVWCNWFIPAPITFIFLGIYVHFSPGQCSMLQLLNFPSFILTAFNVFFLVHTLYLIFHSKPKLVSSAIPSNLFLALNSNVRKTCQQFSLDVEEIRRQFRIFTILVIQTGVVWIVGFLIYTKTDAYPLCDSYLPGAGGFIFQVLGTWHCFFIFFFFSCKKEKLAALRHRHSTEM